MHLDWRMKTTACQPRQQQLVRIREEVVQSRSSGPAQKRLTLLNLQGSEPFLSMLSRR